MIVLAFDFGIKKIGVAVGENITKKARALSVLFTKNGHPNWAIIKQLLKYWDPNIIVVGLPLNTDGTKQKITQQAEIFANTIQCKFNIAVNLHDERFTTVEAKSIIFNQGGFKALKKKNRFYGRCYYIRKLVRKIFLIIVNHYSFVVIYK